MLRIIPILIAVLAACLSAGCEDKTPAPASRPAAIAAPLGPNTMQPSPSPTSITTVPNPADLPPDTEYYARNRQEPWGSRVASGGLERTTGGQTDSRAGVGLWPQNPAVEQSAHVPQPASLAGGQLAPVVAGPQGAVSQGADLGSVNAPASGLGSIGNFFSRLWNSAWMLLILWGVLALIGLLLTFLPPPWSTIGHGILWIVALPITLIAWIVKQIEAKKTAAAQAQAAQATAKAATAQGQADANAGHLTSVIGGTNKFLSDLSAIPEAQLTQAQKDLVWKTFKGAQDSKQDTDTQMVVKAVSAGLPVPAANPTPPPATAA